MQHPFNHSNLHSLSDSLSFILLTLNMISRCARGRSQAQLQTICMHTFNQCFYLLVRLPFYARLRVCGFRTVCDTAEFGRDSLYQLSG